MATAEGTLARLVKRFRPEAATDLKAIYQLDLTGEEGGRWYLAVADRQCSLSPGAAPRADVRIAMKAEDWVALLAGRLDGYSAFFQGRIQVEGDLTLALRLQSIFGF